MAKKTKAKPQKETPNPEQTPPTPNAETEAAPTIKSGLLKLMLPAVIGAGGLIVALALAVHYLVLQPASQQQLKLSGEAQAQRYVQDLIQLGHSYQSVISDVASSEAVKSAISAGGSALAQQEQQLEALFPSASLIKIIPLGKAKKDASTTPPISYAQLDMVTKAQSRREKALPEIHLVNKARYLTLAEDVPGQDRALGAVLVSYDLKKLEKQLPKLAPEQGYVEILQTFSGKASVVISAGNPTYKKGSGYSVGGDYPHWEAVFYLAPEFQIMSNYSFLFWILAAVFAGLGLAATLISFGLIHRAMQHNATILAEWFQALISQQPAKKPFTLGLFASLAQNLKLQFTDYDKRRQKAIAKAAAQPAPNTEASREPARDHRSSFADDVLDVDLHGDDSNLLSGAADLDDSPLELDDMELAEPGGLQVSVDVSPSIFRAYDIRGIVGETLDRDVANAIGMAIGSEAKDARQSTVVVGRDGRHSSADLAEALMEGIRATGTDVVDLGIVPTPILYYATKTLNTQSGVMVTGSHNPPEYNGFKVVIADETLAKVKLQKLLKRITDNNLHQGQGQYESTDISADYMERICNDVVLARPMRIVVDAGNGVAGPTACALLDSLGCLVTPLYTDIDGDFPNHHPDPSNPDNLQDLIRTVQTEEADLGIAFDGDGDRLGIVTTSGKIIWPDRVLMLYARDLLARNPGADILYDVKCTRDIAEFVSSLGGRAILCPTGHSLMKAKMKETNAVVGGELSGHLFFNDRWYGFDDALYSAARLLEILSMEPMSTEEVFAEFPEKPNTPELHIPVSEDNKFTIVEKLAAQGNFEGGNLGKVDGVRVDFPQSWGLIRASNTMPVLVARFEGETEQDLAAVQALFREQLLMVDPGLNVPF